jgi:hypothetical protein
MTGLILFAALSLWIFASVWIVQKVGHLLPNRPWRSVARVAIFALVLPIPLVDEVIGGSQFSQLCKEFDTVHIDRPNAIGKTVYLAKVDRLNVKGLLVPVRRDTWRFLDTSTGDAVLEYSELFASGGLLVRSLAISETNAPLTFNGFCAPGGRVEFLRWFKELNITLADRKAIPERVAK